MKQNGNENPVLSRSGGLVTFSNEVLFAWLFAIFSILKYRDWKHANCFSGLTNQRSWSGEHALQAKSGFFSPHNTICFLLAEHGEWGVITINMHSCSILVHDLHTSPSAFRGHLNLSTATINSLYAKLSVRGKCEDVWKDGQNPGTFEWSWRETGLSKLIIANAPSNYFLWACFLWFWEDMFICNAVDRNSQEYYDVDRKLWISLPHKQLSSPLPVL